MYALTAKGMKYMDQFTSQAGLPFVVLMENAARGVADEVAERIPDKSAKILVLAGHGNNGGDAVAAARWLAQVAHVPDKIVVGCGAKPSLQYVADAVALILPPQQVPGALQL